MRIYFIIRNTTYYFHGNTKCITFVIMAKKINIEQHQAARVVKSYRIDPEKFKEIQSKCKQTYNRGVAEIIEKLLLSHFGLDKKNNVS